jgi:hypothetical protein
MEGLKVYSRRQPRLPPAANKSPAVVEDWEDPTMPLPSSPFLSSPDEEC